MNLYDYLQIPFNKLTEADKKFIQETMSLDDFKLIQKMELELIDLREDEIELPSSNIKNQLMMKFQSNHPEKKMKPSFLNFPIQLWKAAAVLLVCIGGYHFMLKTNQPKITAAIEKTKTDTIILVKNIVKMDTLIIKQNNLQLAKYKPKNLDKNQVKTIANAKETMIDHKSNLGLKTFNLEDLKQNHNHSSKYLNEDSLEDKIGFTQI